MQDWELPRSAFAPVVSVGYLGMMIGGAVAGRAGDRFGRRTALLGSVAAFGGATAAISLVDGLTPLAAFRFLAGVGLGGAIPNGASLAAEVRAAPAASAGRHADDRERPHRRCRCGTICAYPPFRHSDGAACSRSAA